MLSFSPEHIFNIKFHLPGQPDDYGGYQTENCMHMWENSGQWNDIRCNTLYSQATMCEKLAPCV
jgi:hypothetical protein